ncbi:MAG: hypothetical protein KGM42_12820 [Hyphomicrobiales bacterium]|nr:hypothetical protein [Hyphomicrobiales bacterium]
MRLPMTLIRLIAAVGALWLTPALAQTLSPLGPARGQLPTGAEPQKNSVSLSAVLAPGDAQPVRGGLKWRSFEEQAQPDGTHKLVAQSDQPTPQIDLPDGGYIAHAAFGLAGASRRINVAGRPASERVVLNAGALKITPMLGDTPIPAAKLAISIFVPERGNSEAKLVVDKAKPGVPIGLPEGVYHIESTLYDLGGGGVSNSATPTNSVVTTDLRVQAGKTTAATLKHRAATMTLKLVNAPGGEALANTNFTVLTPGGDVIRELIGAFPALVLSEGEYVAIARHDGKTYQTAFKVESTLDRDVEVVAK